MCCRSTAGGGAGRLAALWLAVAALSGHWVANAYAAPADDAAPDAFDALDAFGDDELALDQEVRTVIDHRGAGESRKCYCGFCNVFFCVLLP